MKALLLAALALLTTAAKAQTDPGLAYDLISQSKLIAPSYATWTSVRFGSIPASAFQYAWLSTQELLYWKEPLAANAKPDDGADQFWQTRAPKQLGLWNAATGSVQDLPTLSALATECRFERCCEVSPNGKWLLFAGFIKDEPTWFACHPDATGLRTWPRHAVQRLMDSDEPQSIAHWSRDGNFVTEAEPISANEHQTVQVWTRTFPDVNNEKVWPLVNADMGYRWTQAYEVGGDQMVSIPLPELFIMGTVPKTLDVYSWIATEPATTLKHSRIILPNDTMASYEISPDRKRLLWEFRQGLPITNQVKTGPKSLSLWVSDIDGSNMRMLGQIAVKGVWGSEDQDFGAIHWLPDSKTVSFFYQDGFYKIAVD